MLANGLNHLNPTDVEKPIISEAGKITRAAKITTFLFLTLKNNPLLRNWVHFLNIFLFLVGPEGLGRKNLKIGTQRIKSKA